MLRPLRLPDLGWRWITGHSPDYATPPATNGAYGNGQWQNSGSANVGSANARCMTGIYQSTDQACINTLSAQGTLGGSATVTLTKGPGNGTWQDTRSWQIVVYGDGVAQYFTLAGRGTATLTGTGTVTSTARLGGDPCCSNRAFDILMDGTMIGRYQYAAGPQQQPGAAPAPPPTVTTTPTSQCSGGGSVAGSPVTYTGASTDLPPLLLPGCPAGQTRTGATFPTSTPSGPVQSPLANWSAPTVPSGFPECNVLGRVCQLNLYRVGVGSTTRTACDSSGNCADFEHQAQRSGQPVTVKTLVAVASPAANPGDPIQEVPRRFPNGDVLECMWGPYQVPVDECKVVPTEPNPDPPTDPKGDDGKSCVPHGFAVFNPLEWVYKPVKCALTWAFVPSDGVFTEQVDGIRQAWSASAPGVVLGAASTLFAPVFALHDSSDCQGPAFTLTLPVVGPTSGHPFNTCGRLISMVLGVLLPIETILIWLGCFYAAMRVWAGTVGAESPL